jgi:hypothetical protein
MAQLIEWRPPTPRAVVVVEELYLSTLTPSTVADFPGGRVPEIILHAEYDNDKLSYLQ